MDKLNWKQLEEYIQTLSEEEKLENVTVLDFGEGIIAEVTEIRVIGEKTFGCYGQILESSYLDTEEELKEAEEDSYIVLPAGTLVLIVE